MLPFSNMLFFPMIWKALADPTRRTILDLLHDAPLTTGEISERIENLSRFAVMKHLGILEKANLITIRREGKFRWNYLNPIPIKESYEEWLRQLLHLKKYAAQSTKSMGEPEKSIRTTTLSLELSLEASRARVWAALTEEISQWWPRQFYIHPRAIGMMMDVRLGGHWYELAENGDGQMWGQVIGLEKGQRLLLQGPLSPALGGPGISFLNFDLRGRGGKSQLQFSDTVFGDLSADLNQRLDQDWEIILKKGLRTYVQNQDRPKT